MDKPLRLFIAIELSRQIQQALSELIIQLSPLADRTVKWMQPDHIHLTLVFLGDTPPAQLAKLSTVLSSVAGLHPSFELSAQGCGVFPNPNRPRVLWAGITCPPDLIRIQKDMEAQLSPLGVRAEDRPFSPHLTLGRVNDAANLETLKSVVQSLQKQEKSVFGNVTVKKFTLFQSTLTPQGPIYTPIQRFSLLEKA